MRHLPPFWRVVFLTRAWVCLWVRPLPSPSQPGAGCSCSPRISPSSTRRRGHIAFAPHAARCPSLSSRHPKPAVELAEAFVAEWVLQARNLHGFQHGERAVRGAGPQVGGHLPRSCDGKISSGNFNFVFKSRL